MNVNSVGAHPVIVRYCYGYQEVVNDSGQHHHHSSGDAGENGCGPGMAGELATDSDRRLRESEGDVPQARYLQVGFHRRTVCQ